MNPHSTYTELIEWEWEVFDNQAHLGKGDLVFKNKDGAYLIVETKWINFGSGKSFFSYYQELLIGQSGRREGRW
jgi:hypothetical protein